MNVFKITKYHICSIINIHTVFKHFYRIRINRAILEQLQAGWIEVQNKTPWEKIPFIKCCHLVLTGACHIQCSSFVQNQNLKIDKVLRFETKIRPWTHQLLFKTMGDAYKTFWVWDWFQTRGFFQSMFEQS